MPSKSVDSPLSNAEPRDPLGIIMSLQQREPGAMVYVAFRTSNSIASNLSEGGRNRPC